MKTLIVVIDLFSEIIEYYKQFFIQQFIISKDFVPILNSVSKKIYLAKSYHELLLKDKSLKFFLQGKFYTKFYNQLKTKNYEKTNNLCYLLIVSIVFMNCENELEGIDIQSIETIEQPVYESLHDMTMAGVDFESYFSANPVPISTKKGSEFSRFQEDNGLVFYYEDDGFNFPCNDLDKEDFSKGNPHIYTASPLDMNTDDSAFSPGDIHPEISFESSYGGFYMWYTSYYSMYNSLYTIGTNANLIINFSGDHVNSVSMKIGQIWRNYYLTINIAIYGMSDNLLGNSSVYIRPYGEMWGVTSDEPIKRIVLSGPWPMVDDISFGDCNRDSDGDGCYDFEDPIIYSNMETTINIDSCDSGVDNKITSECGITMSDMIDELEQDTYNNHGQFLHLIVQLTEVWMDEGLITQEEKDLIVACAGQSSIGHNKDLTYVPDDNFEQALIDLGYDNILDDYILTSNINTVTHLDVSLKGIFDLTGIQDFESLTWLRCKGNNLTKLDLNNSALEYLSCWSNSLIKLDVSKCTNLTELICFNNQLTSLDVSKNTDLTSLDCQGNQITSLDVSKNNTLTYLGCQNNQLNRLNAKGATALVILRCFENQLSILDVSGCTNLIELTCDSNQLTNLDVRTNTALNELVCSSNELASLDLSSNIDLAFLICDNNQLTSLDVSQNINLEELECSDNLLSCIQVNQNQIDTKIVSWESGLPLDAYSLDCGLK